MLLEFTVFLPLLSAPCIVHRMRSHTSPRACVARVQIFLKTKKHPKGCLLFLAEKEGSVSYAQSSPNPQLIYLLTNLNIVKKSIYFDVFQFWSELSGFNKETFKYIIFYVFRNEFKPIFVHFLTHFHHIKQVRLVIFINTIS